MPNKFHSVKAKVLLFFLAGLVFTTLIPLGQTPDEYNHFIRSVEVGSGKWVTFSYAEANSAFKRTHDGAELPMAWVSFSTCGDEMVKDYPNGRDDCRGTVLPQALGDFSGLLEQGLAFEPWRGYDWEKWREAWSTQVDLVHISPSSSSSELAFYPARQTSTYSPFAYTPQAIAVAALSPFNPSLALLGYACRLAVLLFSTLMFWLCLHAVNFARNMFSMPSKPSGDVASLRFANRPVPTSNIFLQNSEVPAKPTSASARAQTGLAIFAFLPMVLQQSMSLGADAIQIWSLALMCALAWRYLLCVGERTEYASLPLSRGRTLAEMTVLLSVAALAKPTSLVFAVLLFTVAYNRQPLRYRNKKQPEAFSRIDVSGNRTISEAKPSKSPLGLEGETFIRLKYFVPAVFCCGIAFAVYELHSKLTDAFVVGMMQPYGGATADKLDILARENIVWGPLSVLGHFSRQFLRTVFDPELYRIFESAVARFGQNHATFVFPLIWLAVFWLAAVCYLIGRRSGVLSWKLTVPLVAVFAALSMFAVWLIATDLKWETISSFQGRYLLPIIPLLMLTKWGELPPKLLQLPKANIERVILRICPIILFALALLTIVLFYFCHIFVWG